MVRIFIVEHILKPLNNHRRLGSSYHGCFGMQSKHTYVVGWTPSSRPPTPQKWLFFFLKLETQITEGQYLWQATEFNVLSKWDLGLNGPSYALKAMRSAHHFGPNKGYHHVVAFLTIAHRNPLIKWALCRTSYKRACYTIVGSNNNTRRGQLSKRSQSHRGGVRVRGGTGGGRGGWVGLQQKAPGPVWQNVASAERGEWLGRGIRNERGGRKETLFPEAVEHDRQRPNDRGRPRTQLLGRSHSAKFFILTAAQTFKESK